MTGRNLVVLDSYSSLWPYVIVGQGEEEGVGGGDWVRGVEGIDKHNEGHTDIKLVRLINKSS